MEGLHKRLDQTGGLYNQLFEINDHKIQIGGEIIKETSSKQENWKKKYLEIKIERDNLKKENEKLKKQLKS